ncbi:CGNR zinc finger domain-containing protein [Methylobacillus arboreus]|uniref:CGNR zinc finger domain-containing protein n=1 Tax=Methylobacillus arboreus TaxID=755170 RepID=UPI001E5A4D8A|nr:CGNR zinc finger domain-containing protein [Methylobacillus arboreus]MCB5190880.1 CGNR zinc finger domain-containing protein [Methylobacillus arboreus]
MKTPSIIAQPSAGAPLVADQYALDLLNTVVQEAGSPKDYLYDDLATAQWLSRLIGREEVPVAGLAECARELREVIRQAVTARKRSEPFRPDAFNAVLLQMPSRAVLRQDREGWQMYRQPVGDSPWRALTFLGEAAAELLAEGDFGLIKQCEHPECILWFYDRTKSHRRRWCSMALCGNRHKVSEFRKRQAE